MKYRTLLSHVDTDIVTRAELMAVPAPEPTATFRPVPHYELIDMLDRALIQAIGKMFGRSSEAAPVPMPGSERLLSPSTE